MFFDQLSLLQQAVMVFFSMVITDICWVFTIQRIQTGAAVKAALWGSFLMFVSGVTTASYVHNFILIFPTCLGSFVGTYLAVIIDEKLKKRPNKSVLIHTDKYY